MRYDAGLSNRKGEASGVAIPVIIDDTYGFDEKVRIYENNVPTLRNKCSELKVAIPVLTPERAEKRQNGRRFKENGEPMFTLTAQDKHGVAIDVNLCEMSGNNVGKEIKTAHCLNANDSRKFFGKKQIGNAVELKIKEATRRGYSIATEGDSINFSMPNSTTRRGRVGKGVVNTLDTQCNQGIMVQVSEELSVYAIWSEEHNCYIAIRKLTPRECFRLQGWTDDYFEKAQFVNSDSQLYKQAGNGVTVNVVEQIGKAIAKIGE